MLCLKQSTASQAVLIGPFVDSTDGATAETGLSIANTDVRLSKNGGNLAAKNSGGGTHDENGWYQITLDATDTNTVGTLQLHCLMSGALMVHAQFHVLEEAIYDALIGASAGAFDANGRVDVAAVAGTAQTAGDLAALVTTVDAVVDGIQSDLDNGTDGLGAIKADTAAILVDTADMQPKLGTPAADVSADIAAVKAETALIVADTNELQTDDVPGLIAALNDVSTADINAQVLDVVNVDTFTEPGQGTPTATPTLREMLHYLYKSWRNKKDNDGTETQLYADDGTTVDQRQSTTVSGSTVTKGEWTTGP